MRPPKLDEYPDEELMRQYTLGSDEAFGELYRRHAGKVYGYLKKHAGRGGRVDDILQEALLRLHRNRGRYDPRFPFLPWLFAICRNSLVDSVRRDGLTAKLREELCSLHAGGEPDLEPSSGMESLRQGYATLSAEERQILSLRYAGAFSFDEIADRLNIEPVNARKFSSRTIQKLRRRLKLDDR